MFIKQTAHVKMHVLKRTSDDINRVNNKNAGSGATTS